MKTRFLWFCLHHWEMFQRFELASKIPNQIGGIVYCMRCKNCGNIKHKTIRD